MKKIFNVLFVLLLSSNCLIAADDVEDNAGGRSRYDFNRVLNTIEKGQSSIERTKDKDIVIFLGRSQVGKSTTINFLLGDEFDYDDSCYTLQVLETDNSKAKMGAGDGLSCTVMPAIYTSAIYYPGSQYYFSAQYSFLDTVGFGGVAYAESDDIAASILTEMAVRKSRSVRVAVLEDFHNLRQGVVSFRELGKTLRKTIIGEEIPILFLFNRYEPRQDQAQKFYRMPPSDQEKMIVDSIKKSAETMIAGEERIINQVMTRVAERFNITLRGLFRFFAREQAQIDERITNDSEVKEVVKEVSYTVFLKYNMEKDNVAYIDPLNPNSRQSVLNALERLECIPPASLNFRGYTTDRVIFDDEFAKKVSVMLTFMKSKFHVSRYSYDILENLSKEARDCYEYHGRVLSRFGEGAHNTENFIEKMGSAYSNADAINIRMRSLRNDIERNDIKIREIEESNRSSWIEKRAEKECYKSVGIELRKCLEKVQRESARTLIDKITNFQSSFKEKEYILEKSINLKRTIDDIYSRNEKRVMLFLNIIENLENRRPVFNDFISFYHDVFEYVVKNSEKNDLDEIFLDKKFGVYLLDPVQLICSSEHVSKPYERRMIEEYTMDGGTCPVCEESTRKFKPAILRGGNLDGIISEIDQDSLLARECLTRVRSVVDGNPLEF